MISLPFWPKDRSTCAYALSENGFIAFWISPTSSWDPGQEVGQTHLITILFLFLAKHIFLKYNLLCRGASLTSTSPLITSSPSNFTFLELKCQASPFVRRGFAELKSPLELFHRTRKPPPNNYWRVFHLCNKRAEKIFQLRILWTPTSLLALKKELTFLWDGA